MRIVVNDLAASTGGALSILKSLYEYIKISDKENEWIFLLSDNYLEPVNNIKVKIIPEVKKNWICKLKFDYIYGCKVINQLEPDYLLSLQNTMTYGVRARQGIYIHQAIPFQSVKKFSFLKKEECIYAVYQYLIGNVIKRSVKDADDVFVQTEWMKKAVSEKSKVDIGKITVVPIEILLSEKYSNIYKHKRGIFFYPAGFEAVYKNHDCIYKACELLDTQGIGQYKVILTLPEIERKVSKKILFTGLLDKEAVTDKYQQSTVIFPSYIETVGLPLIEAMMEGCIILVADCEYSREVLKDYRKAYYFDPFSPKSLAELMKKVINGEMDFLMEEEATESYKKDKEWFTVSLNRKSWDQLTCVISADRDSVENGGKNAKKQ